MSFNSREDLMIEEHEPVSVMIAIPVSKSMKERYRRIAEELKSKDYKRITTLARERLEALMNEIEPLLADESA